MRRLLVLLVTLSMLISQSVWAQNYPVINDGKPVTLKVQFHGLTPTTNTTPTPENPNVFNSTRILAEQYMKIHPNVKIEWVRQTFPNAVQAIEWWTTQIAGGTAPDIGFTWGTSYADKGWYMVLNDALETSNPYVKGNKKWKDLFPSYLWSSGSIVDSKGEIVAIPMTLFAGPPTAYYYNKDIFNRLGLKPVRSWAEFVDMAKKIKAAGYIAVAPWSGNKAINTDLWDLYFSIGPVYAGRLLPRIDYNKNGLLDPVETLRACKEGYFSTKKNEYARELWRLIKQKFTEVYSPGWENTDYAPLWNEGKVAMKQDGTWAIPGELSNTKRNFDFGMFPPPVVTKETSKYVVSIRFTVKGPYQPDPAVAFNIFEPSIKAHGGEGVKEAAVDFLKFMTTPDNLSQIILEFGSQLGAVKGCKIPPQLQDWFNNSFPILPKAGWPTAFTSEGHEVMSRLLDAWVRGMMKDDEFFQKFDDAQQKSADDAIKAQNIDTKGWKIVK